MNFSTSDENNPTMAKPTNLQGKGFEEMKFR